MDPTFRVLERYSEDVLSGHSFTTRLPLGDTSYTDTNDVEQFCVKNCALVKENATP